MARDDRAIRRKAVSATARERLSRAALSRRGLGQGTGLGTMVPTHASMSCAEAKIDRIVRDAGFAHHPFVIAPFYYENLAGALALQKQADGSVGWALPLEPSVRCIHMGDIRELGGIVAGAFAQPDEAGYASGAARTRTCATKLA